jgi:hypothetical protein
MNFGIEDGTFPPPVIKTRRCAEAIEADRLDSEGKVKEKQILKGEI